MSYLYEIRNLAIEYFDQRSTNILLCVNYATFVDDEAIRRNFEKYLFQLHDDLIDWRIVKQTIIITSSIETELLTMTRIAKKIMW